MTARKLILIGEIAVGKTSLVRRLTLGRFDDEYRATVGVDLYRYSAPARAADGGGAAVELVIWDIDGDMAESVLRHDYAAGATAAMIVSDISRPETQESARRLGQEFTERFPGRPYVQIVNKLDLAPFAQPAAFDGLARGAERLFLVSAKEGTAVIESFVAMAETIARRRL